MALPKETSTACFPWWHTVLDPITKGRKYIVNSGCAVNSTGNVNCSPDSLRSAAEKTLRESGWSTAPLSLDAYTLARYMASEVGSGTAEERIAVGEAGLNRAKMRGISISQLLLGANNPDNKGYYGPIHGTSGVTSAPYGRWASTSRDPTLADLLIAQWILNGTIRNFANGADDQVGMEYTAAFPDPAAKVKREAATGDYWVGPLPGVDHWHTFLFRHYGYSTSSPEGQFLLQRGLSAVANRARPDWSTLPTCSKASSSVAGRVIAGGLVSVVVLGGILLVLQRRGLLHQITIPV